MWQDLYQAELFDPRLLRLGDALSNPHRLSTCYNLLILRVFKIRTKTGVVRLRRRNWAERDERWPEVDPRAGPHGSDNLPGMAAVCGFPTADQERKKNVPTWASWRSERSCRQTLSSVIFQRLSITYHLMD